MSKVQPEEVPFKEAIDSLSLELNLLGEQYLKEIPRIPTSYKDDNNVSHSVTLCPMNKTIAFSLKPVEGGRTEDFVLGLPSSSRDGAGLFRAFLSVNKAKELVKGTFPFIYGLSPIINDGVRQLTKEFYNLSPKRKLTMEMPDGTFFRWNEQQSAFEIRIYCE